MCSSACDIGSPDSTITCCTWGNKGISPPLENKFFITVKPVYNSHLRDCGKLELIDRWLLYGGKPYWGCNLKTHQISQHALQLHKLDTNVSKQSKEVKDWERGEVGVGEWKET